MRHVRLPQELIVQVISTRIDTTAGLVTQTASGSFDFDDVVKAARDWRDHALFNPVLPVLWDLRDGRSKIKTRLLLEVMERREHVATDKPSGTSELAFELRFFRKGARSAWLLPSGVGRSLIEYIKREIRVGADWRVFYELDPALE